MMTSGWTDERMDDLKHQVDEIGRRMEAGFAAQRQELNVRFDRMEAHLDKRFEVVDRQFEAIDKRFDKVDERFEAVDKRFDKVNERFEGVDERFNRTQEMVIGLHATVSRFSMALVVAVIGLLAAQTFS